MTGIRARQVYRVTTEHSPQPARPRPLPLPAMAARQRHARAVPGLFLPGRALPLAALTLSLPLLAILAAGTALASTDSAAAPAAAPAAQARKTPGSFDLNEIRVEGSTALPPETVEEVIYPFLGPAKHASDVEAARAALQEAYRQAGYVTVAVSVPRQNVTAAGGVVVMSVTEARITKLTVQGARYFVPSAVREGAPSLARGTLPNMKKVQSDLVGLNQLPDRTVTPQLRPGRTPGTVEAELDVRDTLPLHGSLELNNRYNADTHALRLNASLSYNNFFQRGDSGTITYAVAPEAVEDSEITSASYLFHIPASKLSLLLTYLHSNSNVTALGTTNVAGRGTQAGFRLLVPLGADGNFSHSFSAGWDYKKYYELDTYLTSVSTAPTEAPITYYPLSATYAANWQGRNTSTDATFGVVLGLGQAGSSSDEYLRKRAFSNGRFSVFKAGISHTRDLNDGIELWGSLQGQWSNEPLISSEQFGVGGADSVRGYLESEGLGDYGYTLQTELRSPSVARWVRGPVRSWRFHLFADAGYAGLQQTLLGQASGATLSSVGIGTRVNLWGYLNGVVQDAQTFGHIPGATTPATRSGTNRVLFRVYGEF